MTVTPARILAAMECRECEREIVHCHDVLIVHADGSYECSGDGECSGWVETHSWVVTCAELSPDGCCSAEVPVAA
jgi:hypothetical protein